VQFKADTIAATTVGVLLVPQVRVKNAVLFVATLQSQWHVLLTFSYDNRRT
jgi:hypothetical protein